MKKTNIKKKKLELLFFLVFVVTNLSVVLFHEPWFDEAQAWEIAKCATLKEILFVIPHYEGHPPLWHLILAVPAKLGFSYEIGLKTTGFIISVFSAYILFFKSKLPKIARLLIPFSYFFFYQYGVVVRPYGLVVLLLLIIGMNYSARKEHPWRIIILFSLLCLCSAYGIVISGGIALCITIEILCEIGIKKAFSSIFANSRLLSLLSLFIIAILLLIEIYPRTDTFYTVYENQNSFFICLICTLFIFPAECFLTSSSWFSIDKTLLQTSYIGTIELVLLCVIGIMMWLLIICSASKTNIKLLLIPYVFLAIFSAKVYFSAHHLGIVFAFFLFWAEFIYGEEERFEYGKILLSKIAINKNDYKILKQTYVAIGMVCLIVPIIWATLASLHDLKYDYYYGKETAIFLKEKNLSNLNILGSWHDEGSFSPFYKEDNNYVNTVMIGNAVPINAYFDNNIFLNLNNGDPKKGFIYHRRPSLLESKKDLQKWILVGHPDVIIGKPDLKLVYGNDLSYKDYSLVALIKSRFIWKTGLRMTKMPVFIRNDLVDKYDLEILDGAEYALINGLVITEDMKERFYNGEPIEEILKPYLDAMFGEE